MNTSKNISTPWGVSQTVKDIGGGILSISCASHGGLYVPPELLAKMPADLKCNCYAGGGSWFEEDCEWSLVALAFPQYFSAYHLWSAAQSVRGSSDTYMRAAEWLLTPGALRVAAMVKLYGIEHAADYQLGGMSTSDGDWDCTASRLDGAEMIRFVCKEFPTYGKPFGLADLEKLGAVILKRIPKAA